MIVKRNLIALLGAIMLFVFTGCAGETPVKKNTEQQTVENQSTEEESKATIEVSKDEGSEILSTKEVVFSDGDVLMDVLKENYDIETDATGSLIIGIDGVKPSDDEEDKKGWIYTVNNEMASVGAKEYEIKDGDQINFDFQAWK